jgi:hypothetical protein
MTELVKRTDAVQLEVESRIVTVRGTHVIVDSDLADFYGVTVKRLASQVDRNPQRFPEDFAFRLTEEEWSNLKPHFGASSWGGKRKPPLVFTEQGALAAGFVLRSGRADQVSVEVSRAFVKMRSSLHELGDLRSALNELRGELLEHVEERTEELQAGQAHLSAQIETITETLKTVRKALQAVNQSQRHLPPVDSPTSAKKQ